MDGAGPAVVNGMLFVNSGPFGMIVFLTGWVLAMVHIGFVKYIMERLKGRHYPTWVSLGSPGLFVNGNMRNSFLVWRFIVFGAHRALQDEKLNAACRVDIALQIIATPFFFGATYLLANKL